MKIVVAEDDSVSRAIAAATLKRLGHEVVEAADGAQAWTEFDRSPTRVVFSDWAMPRMDGLELCRRIRARPRTQYTYFILITGTMEERQDLLRAMDAGVDDYLTKPLDADILAARLRVAERMLNLEAEVQRLQGFLSICMDCKRIRNEQDVYERFETFIEKRSAATFSHGFCPECLAKRYPAR